MNQSWMQLLRRVEIVSAYSPSYTFLVAHHINIVLTGLDTCQAPRDKAAILVAAHKIIVGKSPASFVKSET
jgi:hypothetical protein